MINWQNQKTRNPSSNQVNLPYLAVSLNTNKIKTKHQSLFIENSLHLPSLQNNTKLEENVKKIPQSTKNQKKSIYNIISKNQSVLDNSIYIELFEKYKRDNQKHRKNSSKKILRKKKKEEIVLNINADNNKDKNSKNDHDNVILKNLNNIVTQNVINTFSTQEEKLNNIEDKGNNKGKLKDIKNELLKKIVKTHSEKAGDDNKYETKSHLRDGFDVLLINNSNKNDNQEKNKANRPRSKKRSSLYNQIANNKKNPTSNSIKSQLASAKESLSKSIRSEKSLVIEDVESSFDKESKTKKRGFFCCF